MFNFQGLAGQKTVENFDVKVLAASKIKLSVNAKEIIGLTEETGVFIDKDVTSNNFWIAAVKEGGKTLSKGNTFGHKVLNLSLGEGTEWNIDVSGVQDFNGTKFFPLTLTSKPEAEETVTKDLKEFQETLKGSDFDVDKHGTTTESVNTTTLDEVEETL